MGRAGGQEGERVARSVLEPSLTVISSCLSPAASTLSQLSDSGQTLSEDSGVDAGEAEASAPGRARQTASTKSRSSKELPRAERTTERANKPVSQVEEDRVQRSEKKAGPRGRMGGPRDQGAVRQVHQGIWESQRDTLLGM